MQLIGQNMSEPWYAIGDFNDVLSLKDRIGGRELFAINVLQFSSSIKLLWN